jgi:hypothetical protein
MCGFGLGKPILHCSAPGGSGPCEALTCGSAQTPSALTGTIFGAALGFLYVMKFIQFERFTGEINGANSNKRTERHTAASIKGIAMRALRPAWLLLTVVLLAGCAATTLRTDSFDTTFKGGPFKHTVVVGVGGQDADRRVFEDIFAEKLRAAGVHGVAGYTVVPDEARRDDPTFAAAVELPGADSVLIVRLLGVDTHTQVVTTMVPGPMAWKANAGFYGPTWFPTIQVSHYEIAQVESRFYETKTRRLIWSAISDTLKPASAAKEAPAFAALIIGQLRARGLIGSSK